MRQVDGGGFPKEASHWILPANGNTSFVALLRTPWSLPFLISNAISSMLLAIPLQVIRPKPKLRIQRLLKHPLDSIGQHTTIHLPSPQLTLLLSSDNDLMKPLSLQSLRRESTMLLPAHTVHFAQIRRIRRLFLPRLRIDIPARLLRRRHIRDL